MSLLPLRRIATATAASLSLSSITKFTTTSPILSTSSLQVRWYSDGRDSRGSESKYYAAGPPPSHSSKYNKFNAKKKSSGNETRVKTTTTEAKVVHTHSTYLPGLMDALRSLASTDGINLIVPARLRNSRGRSPHLHLKVTTEVRGGYKVIARKGHTVQEVFLQTHGLDRAQLEAALSNLSTTGRRTACKVVAAPNCFKSKKKNTAVKKKTSGNYNNNISDNYSLNGVNAVACTSSTPYKSDNSKPAAVAANNFGKSARLSHHPQSKSSASLARQFDKKIIGADLALKLKNAIEK